VVDVVLGVEVEVVVAEVVDVVAVEGGGIGGLEFTKKVDSPAKKNWSSATQLALMP
jgi:hypothetical protein